MWLNLISTKTKTSELIIEGHWVTDLNIICDEMSFLFQKRNNRGLSKIITTNLKKPFYTLKMFSPLISCIALLSSSML